MAKRRNADSIYGGIKYIATPTEDVLLFSDRSGSVWATKDQGLLKSEEKINGEEVKVFTPVSNPSAERAFVRVAKAETKPFGWTATARAQDLMGDNLPEGMMPSKTRPEVDFWKGRLPEGEETLEGCLKFTYAHTRIGVQEILLLKDVSSSPDRFFLELEVEQQIVYTSDGFRMAWWSPGAPITIQHAPTSRGLKPKFCVRCDVESTRALNKALSEENLSLAILKAKSGMFLVVHGKSGELVIHCPIEQPSIADSKTTLVPKKEDPDVAVLDLCDTFVLGGALQLAATCPFKPDQLRFRVKVGAFNALSVEGRWEFKDWKASKTSSATGLVRQVGEDRRDTSYAAHLMASFEAPCGEVHYSKALPSEFIKNGSGIYKTGYLTMIETMRGLAAFSSKATLCRLLLPEEGYEALAFEATEDCGCAIMGMRE